MKSQIELDQSFDYPDSKNRNLIKEFALLVFFSCVFVILMIVALCNSDSIDLFFQQAYKVIAL